MDMRLTMLPPVLTALVVAAAPLGLMSRARSLLAEDSPGGFIVKVRDTQAS
jgi:hypothetical protein